VADSYRAAVHADYAAKNSWCESIGNDGLFAKEIDFPAQGIKPERRFMMH
jgi:hypothetical protein